MESRWLAVLLCAPMVGCIDEDDIIPDLVEQFCQTRWRSCGCESPGVTEIQCVSMLEREGKEAQDEAQEAGLTFDKDCAKSKLERFEPICDVPLGQRTAECYPGICSLYHGNVPLGEPCEEAGAWSDCAQGLTCDGFDSDANRVCADPCQNSRRGDPCDNSVDCLGDLVCTAERVCGDAPRIGEACAGRCARGASCDYEQNVCVNAGRTGDPCPQGDECGDGYRCVDGECAGARALVCLIGSPL